MVIPTFFFFSPRPGKFSKAAQLKAGSIQSLEEPFSPGPQRSFRRHGGGWGGWRGWDLKGWRKHCAACWVL